MRVAVNLILFAALGSLVSAVDVSQTETTTFDDLDYEYSAHMTKYGLSYNSVSEYEMRREIFARNDATIREHNAKEGVTFTMGHNKFSDWTSEEWKNMLDSSFEKKNSGAQVFDERGKLLGGSGS